MRSRGIYQDPAALAKLLPAEARGGFLQRRRFSAPGTRYVILGIILFASLSAFPQGVRFDIPPILTSAGKPVTAPVISLCPGTATISGTACSPATGQSTTDITNSTLCPIGSPVTLTGLNTCQATGDTLGNAGFWLKPGAYIFCVTGPGITGACYNLTVPAGVTSGGSVSMPGNLSVTGTLGVTGASTLSSATITGAVSATNAGVFTNGQVNAQLQSNTNSLNLATEEQATRGVGLYTTNAGLFGVNVPSSSTVNEVDAVAGYAIANSTSTNTVGVYGQTRATANGVSNWGGVMVASDDGSRTSGVSVLGLEVDTGQQSPSTAYSGMNGITSVSAGNGTGEAHGDAFLASGNAVGRFWFAGFVTADNRASTAFIAGATCTSGSCNSQPYSWRALNSGVAVVSNIVTTNSGNFVVTPPSGGTFGVATGTGYHAAEGSAPGALGAGFDQLWGDSTAHRWKMFNNGGSATTVAAFSDNLGVFASGGTITPAAFASSSNCQLGGAAGTASPAACGSAAAGMIAVPASQTSYQVNTTAVTANSEIFVQQMTDNSGLPSSPTCNSGATTPIQSARSAATSFTITLTSVASVTCFKYWIVN